VSYKYVIKFHDIQKSEDLEVGANNLVAAQYLAKQIKESQRYIFNGILEIIPIRKRKKDEKI